MAWVEECIEFFGGEERAILAGVYVCLGLLVVHSLWGVGSLILRWIERRRERKKSRLTAARRVEYTLPERENTFVRSRLNTALNSSREDKETPIEVRLGYVKKMLCSVKEAALTPVERLDVEEMSGVVAAYTAKEGWSSADRKAVNEVCAKLLKLSAKYEIAV